MNRLSAILIPALCAALAMAVPVRFAADVTQAQTHQVTAYRGETLDIEATLTDRGRPLALADGAFATMYWQTNGMESAWWTAPASVTTSGAIRATWLPANDAGAAAYRVFLGVADGGRNYRANMTLRMIGSPGDSPNALPLPVPVLDFASVAVSNAASSPFELRGQGGAVSSVNSQTGVVVLTASDITMADGDRVLEVEINNAMLTAVNAQGQAAAAEQTANGAMAAAQTAQTTADGKLAATWAAGYSSATVVWQGGTYPLVDVPAQACLIANHARNLMQIAAGQTVSPYLDSSDTDAGNFDTVIILDIPAGGAVNWNGVTNGLVVYQPKGNKALEFEAGKRYILGVTKIGYNTVAVSKQELEAL